MWVGPFPKDVWRIILHYVITQYYRDIYWSLDSQAYYLVGHAKGSYIRGAQMSALLRDLSKVHPVIKDILRVAKQPYGWNRFLLARLY